MGATGEEGVGKGPQAGDEARAGGVILAEAAALAQEAAPRPEGDVPVGARGAETAAVPQWVAGAAAATPGVRAAGDPATEDVAARLYVGAGRVDPKGGTAPRPLLVAGVVHAAVAQKAPVVRGVEGAARLVAVPAAAVEGALAGAVGAEAEAAATGPVEEVLDAVPAGVVARVRGGVQVAARGAVDAGVGAEELSGVAAVEEAGRSPEVAEVAPGAGAAGLRARAAAGVGGRRAVAREATAPLNVHQ